MLYDLTDTRTNTENLQIMLRFLSFVENDQNLRIIVSGTYDDLTENAVWYFQNKNGLPANGKVDLDTWNAIKREYLFEKQIREPVYIRPIPNNRDYTTIPDERSDVVIILQVILGVLSEFYDYPPVQITGVYDEKTKNAITIFQEKNGLPETGVADRETWHHLSEEYNASFGD